MVSVAEVAPEIPLPFVKFVVPLLHWYCNDEPVAATVKLTGEPEHMVCVKG
jgi:hypothetical protein